MYHWNEMYGETYLVDQTTTQTLISIENLEPWQVFGQNGIDITWYNDQNQTGQTTNDRH